MTQFRKHRFSLALAAAIMTLLFAVPATAQRSHVSKEVAESMVKKPRKERIWIIYYNPDQKRHGIEARKRMGYKVDHVVEFEDPRNGPYWWVAYVKVRR